MQRQCWCNEECTFQKALKSLRILNEFFRNAVSQQLSKNEQAPKLMKAKPNALFASVLCVIWNRLKKHHDICRLVFIFKKIPKNSIKENLFLRQLHFGNECLTFFMAQ